MSPQKLERGEVNQERALGEPIIILASSSPNRKRLLEGLGIAFSSISPQIEEEKITASNPRALVQAISRQKALVIAGNLPATESHLVIAADSLAVFEGKVLGKPANKKEATGMLHLLSNNTHQFYTGICIIDTQTQAVRQDCVETIVTFRQLADEEIEDYVNTQPVTTMAGGYDISKGTPGEKFLAKIKGSYTNVLGLPLESLFPVFENYGIKYEQ